MITDLDIQKIKLELIDDLCSEIKDSNAPKEFLFQLDLEILDRLSHAGYVDSWYKSSSSSKIDGWFVHLSRLRHNTSIVFLNTGEMYCQTSHRIYDSAGLKRMLGSITVDEAILNLSSALKNNRLDD